MRFTLALGLSWGIYSNSDTVSVSVTSYNMQLTSTRVYFLFKEENKDFNIYRLIVPKYYQLVLLKNNCASLPELMKKNIIKLQN